MTLRKLLSLGAIGLAAAAAPVTFHSNDGLFRLQEACSQASECAASSNYICSTIHSDYKEYRCSAGCNNPPPPIAT